MHKRVSLLVAVLALQVSSAAMAETLQGSAELRQVTGGAGDYSYPAPTMVKPQLAPQAPVRATPPPPRKPLNARVQESAPPPQQRPPMNIGIQKQVVLPQGFMGSWRVMGQRSKVEATSPDFQATANTAFALNTDNTWNINGQPGSYSMSNGQMSTPLWVDKVEGGTAFIRYQHPVGKTMAQEAIVLSLAQGSTQFNGLERISIVKEGEPPRCKVTYQLAGSRMR